jgi:uncharacterized protein (DUF2141 family)
MKTLLLLAAVLAIATPAVAHRRAVAPVETLTITFDAAQVDLGTIVHDYKRHQTSVTRTIVLRVDRSGAANRGLVLLRAARETADARFIIRIDGVDLHEEAMSVATIPLATNTSHRLEIIVPADAEEGALMTNIRWEASTP